MLKFKMMFGILAVVMVLTLAQSGYAQLSISVTGNPNPTADSVGVTEFTNDPTQNTGIVITGTVLSDAPFTGGRLRFTFPSNITNACTKASSTTSTGCAASVNGPVNDQVRISLATGVFTGAAVVSVDAAANRVDITLPCSMGPGGTPIFATGAPPTMQGQTGTMILQGVFIDASAVTTFPASATVSTTSGSGITNGPGNVAECPVATSVSTADVILNSTTVPVINASAQGIGAVATGGIPLTVSTPTSGNGPNGVFIGQGSCGGSDPFHADCGVATIYTSRTVPKSIATFTVKEGFSYAWYHNDSTQFAGADLTTGTITTNDASFQLTFNGIPAGVTLNLAIQSFTSPSGINPTLTNATITTANNTSIIHWNGDLSTTSTDWIAFRITGITVPTSGTLTAGGITVSAKMYPTGTALDLSGGTGSVAIVTTAFPRFIDTAVGSATVVNIVPANTTLLIPFAVAAGAFDTGIAIANTSTDPFGSLGAMAQSGSVQVTLFPSTATGAGTSVGFTTSATKKAGSGIAADGTIASGATWTVNLSELLPLAGQTGGFTGYIFIQANFLPAHGSAYVYNGAGFTSSTNVLVLPPVSTNGRAGNFPNANAEILGF